MREQPRELVCRSYRLSAGARTLVMGILNVTPDSFYDGGNFFSRDKAIERVHAMAREGADIIDIGGQSTRPGAERVSAEEEMDRVMPVVDAVAREIGIPVSVDTFYAAVASEALRKGASIINDITGLRGDPGMAGTIASYNACAIIMHMKGTPKDMQDDPLYGDVVSEVKGFLSESVRMAENAGIAPDSIVIDPGIGFGKTFEHNVILLSRLAELKALGKYVMVGVSRKSFIGHITGRQAGDRLTGTAAACACAVMNGAGIIRVHDVKEMRGAAGVADAITRSWEGGVR
ncbi:MAG: dihydropteroate synthase [Candidatus Omnitrophota bacterium]